MIIPIQLEMEITTLSNVPTDKHSPCKVMLDGLSHPRMVPGLDATLCRCDDCTERAEGGIWWFNSWMRERVIKRKSGYTFAVATGDTLRDNDE